MSVLKIFLVFDVIMVLGVDFVRVFRGEYRYFIIFFMWRGIGDVRILSIRLSVLLNIMGLLEFRRYDIFFMIFLVWILGMDFVNLSLMSFKLGLLFFISFNIRFLMF